jgi:sugar/nucleoside kinase (ribokinase family)
VPPFLNKDVVDAIGAGDSFNAGFIFMFINNKRLQDCLQFGNLTGAINTTAAGGTTAFYSFEEVKKTAKEQFNFLIN